MPKDPKKPRKSRKPKKTRYPVLHVQLEAGDRGWDEGYRFMIEQHDSDRHWFYKRTGTHGSERFIKIHSLMPITNDEMVMLRKYMMSIHGEGIYGNKGDDQSDEQESDEHGDA